MALAIDLSTPASVGGVNGTTLSTASFTPPADSLLVAIVAANEWNGRIGGR